jgi:CheY-like chemotaxis protein
MKTACVEDGTANPLARVLIVDDEPELAELMVDYLRSASLVVESVTSGSDAMAALGTGRFDAVVADLWMPDINGAAIWRMLAQRAPHLAERMLLVTGDTVSLQASRFQAHSKCPALEKPFTKAEFVRSVLDLVTPRAPAHAAASTA